MLKPLFRVKRYAHGKYKFVVRGKVAGKWKRRYFASEDEAIAFAEQQNTEAKSNRNGSSQQNGATPGTAEARSSRRATASTDFAKLLTPAYLGPRIERYLGDSWSMHLPFAYDLMRELAPKVFVELGVKQGESYFSFCQSAAENKINVRCHGVDSWRGDIQTGELDPEIQREVAEYNWRYSSFSEFKAMLFAEALGDFPDASIDLLHIDGTHTYDDVKTDFESWLPKVSPNGIVLLHDVMVRDRGFGVWKLWEEISHGDNSFLFEFGYGLGMWKKQPVLPSDSSFVRSLLRATTIERYNINEYYANVAGALALWQTVRRQSAAETQIAQIRTEVEDQTNKVVYFQREAEEKARHAAQLQGDLDAGSKQIARLEREIAEKTKQLAQLKGEAEEGSRQAAHFQLLSERQSRLLEQLSNQVKTSDDRVAQAKDELLDARWEALTLRGTLLREADSGGPSSQILELENRVEAFTSERDHLRTMLTSLQNDLDQQRTAAHSREEDLRATQAQLRTTIKDLRSEQKQMDRLREGLSRKLILPFGRSQRKLRQLTARRRTEN